MSVVLETYDSGLLFTLSKWCSLYSSTLTWGTLRTHKRVLSGPHHQNFPLSKDAEAGFKSFISANTWLFLRPITSICTHVGEKRKDYSKEFSRKLLFLRSSDSFPIFNQTSRFALSVCLQNPKPSLYSWVITIKIKHSAMYLLSSISRNKQSLARMRKFSFQQHQFCS